MATVSILDLLKAAEQPLALFLHDAMASVDVDYFNRYVRPYVATSYQDYSGVKVYKGSEKLLDSRGQKKSTFLDCDLSFLTHFFEFSVNYKKWKVDNNPVLPLTEQGKLEFPNLTKEYPFTRKVIVAKIVAVRDLRNQWSHERSDATDEHQRSIDISKILDLFREEIQHVVKEKPAMFQPETKVAVDRFVAELIAALRKTARSSDANPSDNAGGGTILSPGFQFRGWLIAVLATIALGAIGLLTWINVKSTRPSKSLTILATASMPVSSEKLFTDHLVRLANHSLDDWNICVVSGSDAAVENAEARLDSAGIALRIIPLLSRVKSISSLSQYKKLFIESVAQMRNAKRNGVTPTLIVLGNLPAPSEEEVQTASDVLMHTGRPLQIQDLSFTVKWWKDESIEPPYLMRFQKPTKMDEKLETSLAASDASLKPRILDLW